MQEAEVAKQLKHMMAFIEQEANEKAEEIDAKAEEEFNIEKGRLVQQQRTKIMEYYEKKEKQVELQKKIQNSNMLNQARLKVLKQREDYIKLVLDEARGRLNQISSDPSKYKQILKGLITLGLFQLLEPEVSVRCRQKDVPLVREVLPDAVREIQQQARVSIKCDVDQSNWLPAQYAGGVILLSRQGKISVDSTLEARLDLLSQKMIPQIRNSLFGSNVNRKFLD